MTLHFISLFGFLFSVGITFSTGNITVPPWGDSQRNPCASEPNGWQLLYWPVDGKCYKIFQKGYPCPESMELTPGRGGAAECQCPPGTAQSPRDAICYKLFTKGPCNANEYFAPIASDLKRQRWGVCQLNDYCHDGKVYWPKDKKCHSSMTRSSCPDGLLLGEKDGLGECMCDPNAMASHYWEPNGMCYEHYLQGPCEKGQVFLPTGKCGCDSSLTQYDPDTKLCYTLGSTGPCSAGHKFTTVNNGSEIGKHGVCICKDGYVLWPDNGQCHRPFTRGPCEQGSILELDYNEKEKVLKCIPMPCGPGKLYFPGGKGCHKVGSNGPCPEDQVVLFQETLEQSLESVSYLGVCGCPTYQLSSETYYPTLRGLKPSENGKCSTTRKLAQSEPKTNDAKEGATNLSQEGESRCVAKRGMVLWRDNSCQLLYNQGPCRDGEWMVPDRGKGQRQGRGWRIGKCECRPGFTITTANKTIICQSPSVILAKFLNGNAKASC